MAKTLASSVESRVGFNYQNPDDISTPQDQRRLRGTYNLPTGTGSGQADLMFRDRRLIGPATVNDDLDLAGGLTDVFGDTLTFAKVKVVQVVNTDDTAGSKLSIGGAGAGGNAWGGMFNGDQDAKVVLEDSSSFLWSSVLTGETVTAGTGDILRIAHHAGSTEIEYDILIIGTSA